MKRHIISMILVVGGMVVAMFSACHHSKNDSTGKNEKPAIAQTVTESMPPEIPGNIVDARHPDVKIHVKRGQTLAMQTEGLFLTAVDAAVQHEADYSVTSLVSEELPPLPQGMVNMTAATAGYRLLPGGEHFLPYAELRMTYDPERLPQGYTPDDIYTSFYDTATLAWVRLERVGVDTVNHEIVSLTTHFTDFINELLKAPEMPETQAFVPTQMTDLEAVSPMDGMTMIQPPTANNNGTAAVSYPLALPAGRGGMQPGLSLTYNSAAAGSGGWLGVGWDIPVPAVTLDTRWGVPRYNASKETEIYLLEGEQLVAEDSGGVLLPMPHRTNRQTPRMHGDVRFHARTGDAHDSIVRHGDGPRDYWWEVVDRTGTTHYYGHYPDSSRSALPCTLRDDRGNIARWPLCESRDLHGNTVRYYYDHATVRNRGAEGRQLYLDSVSYTGHNDTDGYYTVVFCRRANLTTDIPVSCNLGFKEITDQILDNVYVKCGDSITTAWLFDIENGYISNFKNRLTAVAKIDTAEGGMRNFLRIRCHCIRFDEDEDSVPVYSSVTSQFVYDTTFKITEQFQVTMSGDTIAVNDTIIELIDTTIIHYKAKTGIDSIELGHAGSIHRFEYYDAPAPNNMFGPAIVSPLRSDYIQCNMKTDPLGILPLDKATGLGLSKGSSWNVGGTVSAGFGPDVCFTTISLGGSYTRSESSSEGVMALVDLDGDGLADKVYVENGVMYFCRHQPLGDGRFEFADRHEVPGGGRFQKESGYSNTFGAQLSVGFSGSASWTSSKSTTPTYFADVNGDGLVDLVDDGQVLFNNLDSAGNPFFIPFVITVDSTDGSRQDQVTTSASGCGGVIFDGGVDDSITCERAWLFDTVLYRDSADAEDYYNRYLGNADTLVVIDAGQGWEGMVAVKFFHWGWDCSHHDDSPGTEAVRVWIAPREGEIRLKLEAALEEDTSATRRAARHADGVRYTVQHSKGVHIWQNLMTDNDRVILHDRYLCGTCYFRGDTSYLDRYDSTLHVAQGDMLFFRLRSLESRRFDDVSDSIHIEYTTGGGIYDSRRDFVLSGDHCFRAPCDGEYIITCDYRDSTGNTYLEILAEGADITPNSYNGQPYVWRGTITKDSSICISVKPNIASPDWGAVTCRPYIRFYPTHGAAVNDTNAVTEEIETIPITDTVKGWIPCHMEISRTGADSIYDNTLLRRLFGPLYHGWGQFAYHALDSMDADRYIRVDKLTPPDMLVPGVSDASDTVGLDSDLHAGDSLGVDDLSGSDSFESFQAGTRLYNPLSYSSYWVEMTPDVEHQAWVSYGGQSHVGRTGVSNSLQEDWYRDSDSILSEQGIETTETVMYDDPVPSTSVDGTPAKAVRKVNRSRTLSWSVGAFGAGESGSWGTNSILTDYIDLNGDRYPDNVGAAMVQYSQQWGGIGEVRPLFPDFFDKNCSSTWSKGRSYSGSPIRQDRIICGPQGDAMFTLRSDGSGSVTAGGNIGRDKASGSWTDINGDGLPDFVTDDGRVYLNTGYSFLEEDGLVRGSPHAGVSGSVSLNAGMAIPNEAFDVWQGSIQAGVGINGSYNQTTTMLIDINGDGLPDRVTRSIPENVIDAFQFLTHHDISTKVSYNLGNGAWTGSSTLDIERFHASTNYSESLNLGLTFGFTVMGSFKMTVGVDGCPYSGSVNRDYIQLVDVDADGLPDLVSSDSEDSITVRYNTGGKTNLLKKVTNHSGAVFQLGYRLSNPSYDQPSRSWLMAEVTTTDTLNRHNGAMTSVTEYSYANPRYDRHERTSYGYGTVTAADIDPATGDAYRKTTRKYYNNNMLRRGRLREELTWVDSGTLYIRKVHNCSYKDYSSGDTLGADEECPVVSYPCSEAVFTTYYEGGSVPLLVTGELTEYDRYHNVVRYTDMGDTADYGNGLVATFHYHNGLRHNLIGLRKDYEVTPRRSSEVLRSARFEYDTAHGKMTRQILYNNPDSSVYDFWHDPVYGNLDSAARPADSNGERMTFRYTYDNVVHTYPTRIVDSYGDTMSTTYDFRYGKPLAVTDPTGNTMTYTYDFAGRLASVISPLNTSGTPSLVNEYHPVNYYRNGFSPQGYTFNVSPSGHPYAVSLHYDDNGSLITATAVLTNGFGRAIQTKKGLRVGGANMMQVSGRTVVDAFGRTVEQYDPVVEPCTSHWGQYNTGCSAASLTTIEYDVLDRTTRTVQPLGVTTTTAYSIDDDRRFVTAITDPNNNVTTQYVDYEGRRVKVSDAAGGTTQFAYDALGQLISSTDPEDFPTQYSYDNLGRIILRDHPDAGVTRYTYDPAGNLLTETNPLGQISYGYTYYRPLYKRYSYMTGNNVTYTYGTSGTSKGRPVRITDGTGSLKLAYDALGNVTMETRVLVLPNSHEEFRVTMKYGYDSWGRMLTMRYPDAEEVYYSYQWGGDLNAMHGEKNGILRTYIREIVYNSFGQKENVRYGNGTRAHYSYDALHRLAKLQSIDSLGNYMQDIAYTFDRASNVTGITNNAGAVNTLGGTYGNTYAYDALHRLVSSSGAGIGGIYAMDMDYTSSGRINKKFRYRQSATVSGSANMFYGYCNKYQPHAVRRMFDEDNQKLYDFRWDAAGNLGQVSVANQDALFESGRFLFWTEDNRMHTAVDEEFYSYYAYDHSGERRIKLTGENSVLDVNAEMMNSLSTLDRVTLYPSAYMVLNNHGYTKHYYAGAERVAARIGGGDLSVEMAVPDAVNLHIRADSLFWQSLIQMDERVLPENDEGCLWGEAYPAELVGMRIEEIPERMHSDVGFDFGEFIDIMNKMHDYPDESGEPEVYFYHSDHLGSASWITDADGNPVQHLQYLPYGEPFVDQRMSGYNERFTFTGKERDEETGYGYFGARYMDHELMTMWLSVDPMSDKYPSISPYAYCAWNPVRLVDPDGNEAIGNDDWYKNRITGGVIWFDSKAKTIVFNGEVYDNIGEDYSFRKGNNTYSYHQNQCTSVTEHVLSPTDFCTQMNADGTKRSGDDGNCYHQSGLMVKQSGTESLSGVNNNILDIPEGIAYINQQIEKGYSVRVHVDRQNRKTSFDGKGDHWVAISSRTISFITGEIESYGFYDPGTYYQDKGTNNNFILSNSGLVGQSEYNDRQNTYHVVAVRRNCN